MPNKTLKNFIYCSKRAEEIKAV